MTGIFHDPNNGAHLVLLAAELNRRGWKATVYGRGIGATVRVMHPDAASDMDEARSASVVCPPVRIAGPLAFEWAHGGAPIGPATKIEAVADIIQQVLTPVAGR